MVKGSLRIPPEGSQEVPFMKWFQLNVFNGRFLIESLNHWDSRDSCRILRDLLGVLSLFVDLSFSFFDLVN